ncbi:MAG: hypothetical protein ACTSQE_10830 [Candidatus Heimdallarchaeaceae archaeon]
MSTEAKEKLNEAAVKHMILQIIDADTPEKLPSLPDFLLMSKWRLVRCWKNGKNVNAIFKRDGPFGEETIQFSGPYKPEEGGASGQLSSETLLLRPAIFFLRNHFVKDSIKSSRLFFRNYPSNMVLGGELLVGFISTRALKRNLHCTEKRASRTNIVSAIAQLLLNNSFLFIDSHLGIKLQFSKYFFLGFRLLAVGITIFFPRIIHSRVLQHFSKKNVLAFITGVCNFFNNFSRIPTVCPPPMMSCRIVGGVFC